MFKHWPGVINDLVDQKYASETSLGIHLQLLKKLLDVGISKGRSRSNVSRDIPQKWASIEGHQGVRFSINSKYEPWVEKFNGVYKLISGIMDWNVTYPKIITQVISGQAQPEYPDRILRDSTLDEWMEKNEVFSHAAFRSFIDIQLE